MAKKTKIRWKRIIGFGVAGYFMFWSAHSAWQMLSLSRQETQVRNSIAVTTHQNQVIQQELAQLHNPSHLKAILQGTAPVPEQQP